MVSSGDTPTNPSPALPSGAAPPADATLTAFTWNVCKNPDALELACKHLAQVGSCIASFQELPRGFDADQLRTWSDGKLKLLSQPVPDLLNSTRMIYPKAMLVASDDIDVDPKGKTLLYNPMFDDQRRLDGVAIRSRKGWENLQVLGLHAWDRRSRSTPSERTAWMTIMRNILDVFWSKGEGPLLVLGDLNANPWEYEITARTGLYALRHKDWPLKKANSKLPGVAKYVTPLFNPMWQLLGDGSGERGTLHYNSSDLRWHCFDQIIVSSELREFLGKPTVLTKLLNKGLVDKHGVPKKKKKKIGKKYKLVFSDHLPLQMVIEIGKVKICRLSGNN